MGNYLSSSTRTMDDNANPTATPAVPKSIIKYKPDDLYYNMTGEKLLVIFNHYKFQSTKYYYQPLQPRTGTQQDVESIKNVFGKLGFKFVVHHDKDYNTIVNILKEMRNADYSRLSCLCVVILTHGFQKDGICASDRAYNLKDVTEMFENHPTLDGKPKLFFVQACRGQKMDAGTTISYDGDGAGDHNTMVIPSHADFLVMRSTKEDFKSYRNKLGSWMIQDLCAVISESHEAQLELDLLQIITITNKRVAILHSTNTLEEKTRGKKQMPETTFTLTKLLKF